MNRVAAGDIPFIKIALIGDSGVGKSTLSSVLSTGCFESSPIYRPTVGCEIKVLSSFHELQGKYFVELWDLGGNPRFGDARPICYEDCDGYVFLWDSSSEVTYHSLQSWLAEVSQARENLLSNSSRRNDFMGDGNSVPGSPIDSDIYTLEGKDGKPALDTDDKKIDDDMTVPLLIVGNKIDKLSASEKLALQTACAQQVFVSSRCSDGFDTAPFYKFFNQVYDKGRFRQHEISGEISLPSSTNRHAMLQDFQSQFSPLTGVTTPLKASRDQSNVSNAPISALKSSGSGSSEEVTWTSPLRGFTSSLFSLSASSLRYRSVHTPDHAHAHAHAHTHMPEKV